MPIFSSDDPSGWLFRVERYFILNHMVESEKITAAVVCLEGKALGWYQWMEVRSPILTWPVFRSAVRRHFCNSQVGSDHEHLFH